MERCVFDPNIPYGKMSLLNFRNVLRALHECDFISLRPSARFALDDMEYSTDALAQASWSDFVSATVKSSTTVHAGSYALEVSDCGVEDAVVRTFATNLSAYEELKLWARKDVAGDSPRFFLKDSNSQASWTLDGLDGVTGSYMSDLLTLASPDYGSVDLSDVSGFGFSDLVSDTQYLFDSIEARVGMAVAVESSSAGGYYENVYRQGYRVSFAGGPSPTVVAPSANPRIDVLFYSSDLYWRTGTEAASPAEPSVPVGCIPICSLYCKPTMKRIVGYEDKDAYTDEGYILKDIRPIFSWGVTSHSSLTELTSDTHTQYILQNGTRAFSGDQSVGSNKLTHLKKASSGSDAVRFDQLSDAISYREVAAWGVCDGVGVIRQSFNLNSVTYISDGKYCFNLTTAMVNSDYSVVATAGAGQVAGLYDSTKSDFTIHVMNSSDAFVNAYVLNVCMFGT